MVAEQPIKTWLNLFNLCFEWRYDGGMLQVAKDKYHRTGQYRLREWPKPGGIMMQYNNIIEILIVIAKEKNEVSNKI